MPGVSNSSLLVDFDLTRGISLRRVMDVVSGRNYLPADSPFFEFAVDNGTPYESNTGLITTMVSEFPDGSAMSMEARSTDGKIGFRFGATLAWDLAVALFELTAFNLTPSQIFLRVVLPKIQGVTTGDPANMMGAIPKEAGSVAPLSPANPYWGAPERPLGMLFLRDVGLPNSRNNMELASIYDGSSGGGIFFCDVDGDLDNGVVPLQFNLWPETVDGLPTTVAGFWIGDIPANASITLSRLAIGVHTDGDWHRAVDYYTSVHRPRWSFPAAPSWFREAGAIYTPAGGGAGGIYLDLTPATLADGAVWNAWDSGAGTWNPPSPPVQPIQISPGGFTPTGSLIQAIKQNAQQVTVFATGFDGAIWAVWESDDGPWKTNRNNLFPARITPPGWVTPGIPFACGQQGDNQWDVFFARPDGSVWVTWEAGDGTWTDGQEARRFPAQIVAAGPIPPGAHLAAARLGDVLNLFCIGKDGAIWVWSVRGVGGWSSGTALTPANWFPNGAPLVALQQNDSQLNVFAVDNLGTVRTVWLTSDPPGVQLPVQASPVGLAPARAFLAAANQSSSQLDVFFVGTDGAVWVTWQQSDGWRTDGNDGRLPKQITPPLFAEAGATLTVATRNSDQGLQLQVFVTGRTGGIWVTHETGDSPWTDGQDARPGPLPVAGFPAAGFPAPPSSGIAAVTRNDSHVDVFGTIPGRINSFLELPNLLAEARALGTNILYLNDYWEGTDQGGDIPYANKGDYMPRSDLGGEEAFIEGIKRVHQFNGRVLLYVESFIIYQYSAIGMEKGPNWGGRTLDGKLWGLEVSDACYPNYPFYYTMLAPYQPWQEHLIQVARRLVGQYGADGIMLDSCAWQMNRPMYNSNFFPLSPLFSVSAQDYSRGVLDLVRRIRSAIQENNHPDAVVIGETTAGPVARYWDGGLNADLGFGNIWQPSVWPQETKDCPLAAPNTPQRLTASPVRYGIPEVRIFGNGWNLNGLHQVFAAGHGLALCSNFPGGGFMFDNAAHIQQLVEIRVTYGDALIHGAQINQPRTSDPLVAAYQYQGSQHRILTVVNTADTHSTVDISLTPDPGGSWKNLLDNETYQTRGGVLNNVVLTSGQGSLLVLLNVPGGL